MSEKPTLSYLYKDAVLSDFRTIRKNIILAIAFGLASIAFGIFIIMLFVTSPLWVPLRHISTAYKARSALKDSTTDRDHSFIEKAVGTVVGLVLYDGLKDEFRRSEMRLRIRKHVRMAEALKAEVEEVQDS